VGEDLVATAGHCITPSLCKDTSFIFGFHLADVTSRATDVAAKDVYRCKEIVMRQYNSTIDYALVRLDRKVVDQKPLTLAKQPAAEGEEILVIGNPSGLPTKISAGASVRSVQGSYFVANLDTYQGNSGSAVFRQSTGEVIGILVRGESDFKYEASKSCYKSNLCADAGCRGEDSTNISFILNAMTN
jgi:V8-like Glu-specific endopeptidase